MKKRTTMLMSALFAAGAFALNGNVAKADNVQAVNNNNANSTEVKQNDENSSYNEIVKENTKYVAELRKIKEKQSKLDCSCGNSSGSNYFLNWME